MAEHGPEAGRQRFESYLRSQGSHLGSALHDVWQSRDESVWAKDPWFFLRLGELADDLGQVMFAHDVLGEGLRLFPSHLQLTQRYSLLLIKCGFLLTARDLLSRLLTEGHFDEETLGILGRVHKEMWLIEGNGDAKHPHLARARELYLGAFRRSRGSYSGINAASLSRIMGDRASSLRIARDVIRICAAAWKDPSRRDYWTLATLAEAFLLLGRQETARKYCRLARARIGRSWSGLVSTRRQFALLARYTDVEASVLDTLRIPPVIAFSGHRVDASGGASSHFPPPAAEKVKQRIAAELERLDARIGYASAASGGDVLFHECLQERSGESNVVLPFDREEFFEASVKPAGVSWVQRANGILQGSTAVEEATRGGYHGEDVLFSYANQLIIGKAVLRSRFLETEPTLLVVWDGTPSGKVGGTSECVALWDQTGFPCRVIDPSTAEVRDRSAPRGRSSLRLDRRRAAKKAGGRRTMAILFADVAGFSRLGEEQVPAVVQGFLQTLAGALDRSRAHPEYRNTWGDAACFVFDDPLSAAECAIAMRDSMRGTDWPSRGLPADFALRIALHAGPVFPVREPLLGRDNFFGYHMNQAARIEPITRPGNVYASEAFACLLLADPRNPFDCRYVGVVVLPKDFGSYPIYHVKRKLEVG